MATKKSAKKAPTTKKTKTTKTTSAVKTVKNKTTKPAAKKNIKLPSLVQEENNYGRTIIAAFIIVIIFLGGYFILRDVKNGNNPFDAMTATADEKEFKKEYESINGMARTNGQTNKKVNIKDKNRMEYIDIDKAIEILEEGSGVIYFGYAADPLCRNAVLPLIDAVTSTDLEKVYYVNVREDDKVENDIRDTYELNEHNKPKQVREGNSRYKELLVLLANQLPDYVLTTEKGKTVNTGEKRLEVPLVVAVKKGEVIGYHLGTIPGNKEDDSGKVPELSKSDEKDLEGIYQEIIEDYLK